MSRIPFEVEKSIVGATHDSAIILHGEHPAEALADAMVQSIATDIWFTAGGVRLFLAAWQDPEHWSEEWQEAGVDDPFGFIAGLVHDDDTEYPQQFS